MNNDNIHHLPHDNTLNLEQVAGLLHPIEPEAEAGLPHLIEPEATADLQHPIERDHSLILHELRAEIAHSHLTEIAHWQHPN